MKAHVISRALAPRQRTDCPFPFSITHRQCFWLIARDQGVEPWPHSQRNLGKRFVAELEHSRRRRRREMASEPLEVCIGVLALQGAFREHLACLRKLLRVHAVEVRTKEQLPGVDGLIIPGGALGSLVKLAGPAA